MPDTTQIEVFRAEDDTGEDSVGLVLVDPSLIEYEEGKLQPGCALTPGQARCLADELNRFAAELES